MVVIDNKNFYIVKGEILGNLWKVKTDRIKRAIVEEKNLYLVDVYNKFSSSTFSLFEIDKYKEVDSEYVFLHFEEETELVLPPIIGNAIFKMDDSWVNLLFYFILSADYQNYMNSLKKLENVFPISSNRWNVFVNDFYTLKAVIISEHSYPNEHNNGIAFSTFEKNIPKTLSAIKESIRNEKGLMYKINDDLIDWQTKGMFLLNREFVHGHYNHTFFTKIVEILKINKNLEWLLVGNGLWYLGENLDKTKVLYSEHPLDVLKRKEMFNSAKFLEL